MAIMREDDIIRTAGMTVEEKMGALITAYNENNRRFLENINALGDAIYDNHADISELFDITKGVTKKLKGKASKLGLALIVIGGITYVIKNEMDKNVLKGKIIEFDKQIRECCCSPIETEEDEATSV